MAVNSLAKIGYKQYSFTFFAYLSKNPIKKSGQKKKKKSKNVVTRKPKRLHIFRHFEIPLSQFAKLRKKKKRGGAKMVSLPMVFSHFEICLSQIAKF